MSTEPATGDLYDASAIETLTRRAEAAEAALEPFARIDVQPVEQTVKLIRKSMGEHEPVTVIVTKGQFLTAHKLLTEQKE
jgi:hypothetical protein